MNISKTATMIAVAFGLGLGPALAADTAITPATKPETAEAPQAAAAADKTPYKKVEEVFSGNTTVAGEPLVFPKENPSVKSLIVTMMPGEKTAWHQHGVPLYAYILEGEITVTYEGIGKKVYTAGTGLLEAMHVTHQGHNTGDVPVRILAVFLMGDDGKPTIAEEGPESAD